MLHRELEKLARQGKPIRVGVSGAGWIGSGFVQQVSGMKGMDVCLLADEDIELARRTLMDSGVQEDAIVETESVDRAHDALKTNKKVITPLYTLAAKIEEVDIVADVTPSPAIGAETALSCIRNGKDIVMVNIEADVTVGRILKKRAEEAGVLYTVSSGDEPGCLAELWDFVVSLGYEPIAIGKGKNNPLNIEATPETVAESARKSNKDPYTVASYVDGTKTMFEMTCAANATGCLPMRDGMVGPEATVDTVSEIFALKEDGGITEFPGVVDFVQGTSMAGGVFITVRISNRRIRDDLIYLKVGRNKYFTFFRPYHLWFLEAPISVARAFLYKQQTLVPKDVPVAEVMAVAKKDLRPGDTLDTFGGFTFHGVNTKAENAVAVNALPVGLAVGAEVIKSVKKGEIIKWDHVRLDETSTVVKLRREQDSMLV